LVNAAKVWYGNPNLNQNADIILNEVGSTNRSVLNGALEVFGLLSIAP
jgi:filamentous hemagglutinin family protein